MFTSGWRLAPDGATKLHRRVAFPLPGVPLKLQWVRPTTHPANPRTLGEHLRRRRAQTGLLQKEVAGQLGINTWTYLLWESDRTKPTVRLWPLVLLFLGYDPFPKAESLPQMLTARRHELGLTISEAAKLVGVDEGTFGRWERGDWLPRTHDAVRRFLTGEDQDPG